MFNALKNTFRIFYIDLDLNQYLKRKTFRRILGNFADNMGDIDKYYFGCTKEMLQIRVTF